MLLRVTRDVLSAAGPVPGSRWQFDRQPRAPRYERGAGRGTRLPPEPGPGVTPRGRGQPQLVASGRGRPGPRDSSIGGPVLWPATEPWPRCDAGDRHLTKVYDPDAGWPGRRRRGGFRVATDPRHIAAPMVGVAQLFAGDVQGLPCPAGTDVCPRRQGRPRPDCDRDQPSRRRRGRRGVRRRRRHRRSDRHRAAPRPPSHRGRDRRRPGHA